MHFICLVIGHEVQQVVRDREAQAEEVFKRREAEREKKLDEDKCLVQRATRVTCLEDVKIFETNNLLHITFFVFNCIHTMSQVLCLALWLIL